ncbi:hypothetical protein C0Q70_14834 [Pomacea canaliculata]|uniref:Uncharacterized protein n=1 Tax=Pomacea canaliculata TaxID=400727 RepID=A0A2T7NT75_POMCA|nr:hypothetical protein C0Q70_14834 [Pomacea canaliculata]
MMRVPRHERRKLEREKKQRTSVVGENLPAGLSTSVCKNTDAFLGDKKYAIGHGADQQTLTSVPRGFICMHSHKVREKSRFSDKQRNHFPNRPRDLNISHTVVGNRRLFNITWKPPYDYSYKVLDGFELILYIRRNRSIDFPECIFFNLSGINWTEVEDIHDVLFFFDCWHEGANTELDLHMRLYSTPLPERQALFASRNLSLAAATEWKPRIHCSVLPNGTAFVTIYPKFPGAAHYQVCMINNSVCHGNVSEHEEFVDSIIYMIINLDTRLSYEIWVRPETKAGHPLDTYVVKKDLCIFPHQTPAPTPAPEPTTLLPTSTFASDPSESQATLIALGTLLAVIIFCVILGFVVKKGYLKRIFPCFLWFHCCRQQPLNILLLYIHEDEDFYTSFVTTHTGHLKSIIPCNFVDSRDVRHQSMPNSWLTSQTHRCHVLVYVSPLLLQCLYGQNFTSNNAYHTIIVEAVRSLTDRTFSRHKRAVFVLSGCCGLNADAAGRLTRDFNLPCHLVAQNRDGPEGGVTLNSPCSLLHEILGTKMCPCFTYLACSDSTGTARSLLQALQRLQNSSQYSDEYISGFLSSAPCHGATDSPYRSQCLPEDCNVSLLNGVDSGFEPGGKGSNSDLSSSPPCTFINHEDTSEMDLYQYQVIEGSRGINPETISFIRPEELMSCSGSQINIEKCLHTINENSGRHW